MKLLVEGSPTGRSLSLLRTIHKKGKPITTYTLETKQNEFAEELGISRQALNVHLRKLRDLGLIRTGRGFIDVTEKGLNILGGSANPAFIFLEISPTRREEAYKKISQFPAQRIFRVAGDMDAILLVERNKLDEALNKVASIKGVQDTKSYVTIKIIK